MALLPISQLLRHHAGRKPSGAIAIAQGTLANRVSLTWDELDRRTNQRARLLQQAGVVRDDLVTVALHNRMEFFETTFAIWKAGATPNIIPAKLPWMEMKAVLETANPRVVVTEPGVALEGWKTIAADVSLQGFDDAALDVDPASFWKAMTSGGSTGRPKIIVDNTPAVRDPEQSFMLQPLDGVMLNPGPLYHNAPFLFSHTALFAGNQVSSLDRFDAEEALRLIEHDRVQWMNLVPTMMRRIVQALDEGKGGYDMSSLKHVFHMAAAVAPDVKERWIDWLGPDRIMEVYAATEVVGGTIISGGEWLNKRGSVGRPFMGSQVKIVTEDGAVAAPGEVGEVYMMPERGAGSTYHYLGAERRADAEGWESVGDIGWLDEDGYLFLADRRADLILRGGANIYPAEIEAILELHPDVATAVAVGLPDADLGQRVHAIIEPKAGRSVDEAALTVLMAEHLARFKHPQSYEFVSEPLRDEAGKVRRSALRDARL